MQAIPAAFAALTPKSESSITTVSLALMPNLESVRRNVSGAGFGFYTLELDISLSKYLRIPNALTTSSISE